ncbi:NADH dehydrogenase [ubiquinone] 1 beta subcomplex subunit 4-like isoform X2 [Lytechinus pictus]|uniref:NADH dehydrogenase [ubiquinone] 1 beta subcomplex subunit 4-like isoform X2 n=1 Tax=Lytechinus pictus TaxID=7653 RepID=UPI0030B9F9D3
MPASTSRKIIDIKYQKDREELKLASYRFIDPAYFRWNYARHNSYNYFKATKLTSIAGAIMGVAIPVGLIYFFYRHRKYTEEMYESGKWKKPRNLVNG